MRLTLRTLLAYTDGLLGPEDAEEIGTKIEESEFATNLIHRTRDVTRRMRLAAPSLTGGGSGLDANTVAEYLDNTLHDDRVPDFEKVCLESDVHLAELASCHQILTLVLGEAAEIAPDARQRMYDLPMLVESAAESPDAAESPETAAEPLPHQPGQSARKLHKNDRGESLESKQPLASPRKKRHRRPSIPDYLRESRKPRRILPTTVAVLLITVCLAGLLLNAAGQFKRGSRLMDLLFGKVQVNEVANLPEDSRPEDELGTEPKVVDLGIPEVPPAEYRQPEDLENDQLPNAPHPPKTSAPPAIWPPSVEDADVPDPPIEPPSETLPEQQTAPIDMPLPEPRRMGRLTSSDQVLLRYNSASVAWERVPGQGVLISEESLVALSGFRPEITLSVGVNLKLIGSTKIDLMPMDQRGIAGIRIEFGKLLIMPLAEAETGVRLMIGHHNGVITFADAESVAAVEIVPVRLPGTNPETDPAFVTAKLYAKTGQVIWDGGAEYGPLQVLTGTGLIIDSQAAPVATVVKEIPEWAMLPPLSDPVQTAAKKVEKGLQQHEFDEEKRPPKLLLMELANPSRPGYLQKDSVRLATLDLADIDEFDSMVAALGNSDHRLDWMDDCVEYLREAVARSPETARAVRLSIERKYSQAPELLYRMLWGYSNENLVDGEDGTLVGLLDHPNLAHRVLSFWNLKTIVDKTLYYDPKETTAERRKAVAEWREQQEKGKIRMEVSGEPGVNPPNVLPGPPSIAQKQSAIE